MSLPLALKQIKLMFSAPHHTFQEGKSKGDEGGRQAGKTRKKRKQTRTGIWRATNDCSEGCLPARLQGAILPSLEAARAKAGCRGLTFMARDYAWSFWKETTRPHPQGDTPEMLAWLSSSGTFTVHFREQLAQGPLHLPGAVDEGRHHPEQLVLVLLPDHRDGI